MTEVESWEESNDLLPDLQHLPLQMKSARLGNTTWCFPSSAKQFTLSPQANESPMQLLEPKRSKIGDKQK